MKIRSYVREFVRKQLEENGHYEGITDDQSLIAEGLLDSLTVVHIVVFMEKTFGIDFGDVIFDQDMFDTVDRMVEFIEGHKPSGG